MDPRDYILTKIEGDYAYLTDINTNEEFFIARALLPEDAGIGTKLHYEMLSYTICD